MRKKERRKERKKKQKRTERGEWFSISWSKKTQTVRRSQIVPPIPVHWQVGLSWTECAHIKHNLSKCGNISKDVLSPYKKWFSYIAVRSCFSWIVRSWNGIVKSMSEKSSVPFAFFLLSSWFAWMFVNSYRCQKCGLRDRRTDEMTASCAHTVRHSTGIRGPASPCSWRSENKLETVVGLYKIHSFSWKSHLSSKFYTVGQCCQFEMWKWTLMFSNKQSYTESASRSGSFLHSRIRRNSHRVLKVLSLGHSQKSTL